MEQIDKSDKAQLTFGLSTSDKVLDDSTKPVVYHHANDSVREFVKNKWSTRETKTKSVINVITVAQGILVAKHPAKTL